MDGALWTNGERDGTRWRGWQNTLVNLLVFVHLTRSEKVWLERNSDTQTVNQPLSLLKTHLERNRLVDMQPEYE